jgi:hypothetical protein
MTPPAAVLGFDGEKRDEGEEKEKEKEEGTEKVKWTAAMKALFMCVEVAGRPATISEHLLWVGKQELDKLEKARSHALVDGAVGQTSHSQ